MSLEIYTVGHQIRNVYIYNICIDQNDDGKESM